VENKTQRAGAYLIGTGIILTGGWITAAYVGSLPILHWPFWAFVSMIPAGFVTYAIGSKRGRQDEDRQPTVTGSRTLLNTRVGDLGNLDVISSADNVSDGLTVSGGATVTMRHLPGRPDLVARSVTLDRAEQAEQAEQEGRSS
jgi:hypothetical protein